jgi:Mg2+-importing ATPase
LAQFAIGVVMPHPVASSSAADDLAPFSALSPDEVLKRLETTADGLSPAEVTARLKAHGPNSISRTKATPILLELWNRLVNPLNGLLLGLAVISWLLSDVRSAVVIAVMVVLSVTLGFLQEHRSGQAAAALANMVRIHARVKRSGVSGADSAGCVEVPLEDVVPGDLVQLSAGDMIPADLRLIAAKDLFVNQSTLTGESLPVEKLSHVTEGASDEPLSLPDLCFMGSSVTSGFGTGAVVHTGPNTHFGQIADKILGQRVETSFDKGINRFAMLMLRFILVMTPTVFLINGLTKHNWMEALLFAVAVAVGLTPEMLPMIVTVNLARGAIAMSKKRVIVKRLNSIQNFGAMDVLCTDKTGTLTQDKVTLRLHLNVDGDEDDEVLRYAYLNSHFQSGLKNLLDTAVLEHVELEAHLNVDARFTKIDEIPFDFTRRRLSVIVSEPDGQHLLICKGAVEEVFTACTTCRRKGVTEPLDPDHLGAVNALSAKLNGDGFRVVAVASRKLEASRTTFSVADESELTLIGFIAFLDPAKETAASAIAALQASGVTVKILTGDNDLVTRKICKDVGLDATHILLGRDIAAMDDAALVKAAQEVHIFAKLAPAQKARVITALQGAGHVVGYMGDGINDGPALKAADVGVSVDTAVDIAKDTADIILLEKSLEVLNDGVMEGRRVFANITKYIKMGSSSNFGNMFSVLGASMFLPFLPMAPLQVLTNNLLYDFSQTTIPTDNVDEEYLKVPRKWEIGTILRFMLYVGPISSIFDYATFFTMIYVFKAWTDPGLFQTGWFVESVLTQTLIIHVIRTGRIPFLQSRASTPLIISSLLISAVAVALPYSPLGATLGFKPLPLLYWPIVTSFLIGYAVLGHITKTWFIKRFGL